MQVVSKEMLTERIQSTQDKTEFMKLQAMYLYTIESLPAKNIAQAIGKTPGIIYQWAHRLKKFGLDAFQLKPRGGRKWAYMSLEEEVALLEELQQDATKGLVVISKIVRNKAEEKLGRPVSADYAEDLLKRHDWRKIMPRPKHPKSTLEQQEEFKKKLQNSSKKQQALLTPKMRGL